MYVTSNIKRLLFLLFIALFGLQLHAQSQDMTLWWVDAAHLAAPNVGEAIRFGCDGTYYIEFQAVDREIIYEIKNEGTSPLTLTQPLTLAGGNSPEFTIATFPAKSVLQPNEKTHFIVKYTAPATYSPAQAMVIIQTDNPVQSVCAVNFIVGSPPIATPQILDENNLNVWGGAFDYGSFPVGIGCTDNPDPITKTFTYVHQGSTIPAGHILRFSASINTGGPIFSGFISVFNPAFTFVQPTLPAGGLAAGESVTFQLIYTPLPVGSIDDVQIRRSISSPPFTCATCPFPCIGTFCPFFIITIGVNAFEAKGTTTDKTPCGLAKSQNDITFGDPCKCDDPKNCAANGTTYFHDTLSIPATATIAPGQSILITSSTNFFTDIPCNGGTLTAPTPNVTLIPETSFGSGVYKLEFWRPSGLQPTLSVSINGAPFTAPLATFQPICTEAECNPVDPVPTFSQWGLLLFALVVLNIALIVLYRLQLLKN